MSENQPTTRNFCDETERLIDDYLEGEISPKDKEIMESHISSCEGCKAYLDDMSKLKLQLGTLSGNYEYLSSARKEELWKEVDGRAKPEKARIENYPAARDPKNSNGFIYRFRYAFTAAIFAAVAAVIYLAVRSLGPGIPVLTQQDVFGMPSYWKVASLSGNPYISNEAMAKLDSIRDGEYIVTNDSSRAEIYVADIGKVIIEPNTKLMIVKGEDGKNKLSVEYGTIDADMKQVAEPVPVMLPSAIAMDEGGQYKLTVDHTGDGLFFVKSGTVEVTSGNKQSVATAGTYVMTKKDKGVGTPFAVGTSPLIKKALYDFDFGKCDQTCISTIVNSATTKDAVTLVNLLPQLEGELKDNVYSRAIVIAPPPPGVPSRDSIPFIDEKEIEEWVEKIQIQVNEQLEKNMKELDRNLEKNLENLKVLETISIDTLKWADDLEKNFKIKVKTFPGDYDFEFESPTDGPAVYFDKEEFKKEMEELKKDLKEENAERKEEIRIDMQELNESMKELHKELKEAELDRNDELKRELEKAKTEIERTMKEMNNNMKFNFKYGEDGNVEVEVDTEKPKAPETPEVPETQDGK